MGKSLPRICKACNATIKSNFNKHTNKVCKRKNGFSGWIFLNRQGKRVGEDSLPTRLTRIADAKPGQKIGVNVSPASNLEAEAWRKIKRGSVLSAYSPAVRERAFSHFAKLMLLDTRHFKVDDLIWLVRSAAEDLKDD